ncbi:MAG: histidine--tRNA ligase [Rickettsiales bacterium]|jgi:histidyl-tRNA synthetase|nr:histidine--tRNA ligase [Rickettsiales bacterium]
MRSDFRNVKGTQDFFGDKIDRFNFVIETLKKNAKLFNFKEISTPILEFSNLFERNIGDGSDIILKEIYKFQDRGGDSLALRPEFTAGIVRSLIENFELNRNLPQKLFSYGPVFRYDRPQKGRYRQLHQINVEMYGNDSYIADLEIIVFFNKILSDLGIKNITLEINSLGSNDCKNRYEKVLFDYFSKYKTDLSEDSKVRLEKNPLRILDSKENSDKKLLENVPKIHEFYSTEEKEFYDNILKGLNYLNINYYSNPLLVRGLDYYTSSVFEFTTTDLGSQSAIGGGGRYDNMVEQIGNERISAIGFGGGIERMSLLINKEFEKEKLYVVIPVSDNEIQYAFNIVNKLRTDKNVEFIYEGKFKKKMEKMNKCGADFAIIIGEDEIKNRQLKIKNLKDGSEKEFMHI